MNWLLDRISWPDLDAAESAASVPAILNCLHDSETEKEATKFYWQLDGNIVVDGHCYEAGLAAIPALIDALFDCTDAARVRLLELLVQLGGYVSVEEEAEQISLMSVECLREVARGFAVYVSILQRSTIRDEVSHCVDLLGICCRADPSLRSRTRYFLERVRQRDQNGPAVKLIDNWLEELGPVG